MQKNVIKRIICTLMAIALISNVMIRDVNIVKAAINNPIAIMVELSEFDDSIVGDDGEDTLLWKKGNASISSGELLLTNNSGQAGSVVKRNQINLEDGFSTYFQMYFSGNADGIAFVIYSADEPKLGEIGGALGYGDKEIEFYGTDNTVVDGIDNSIHDSIIVEFDTWKNYASNADQYDLNDNSYNNHVAIMLDGNQAHSRQSDGGEAVSTNANLSGNTINAWVDYKAGNGIDTTGTITVTYGTGISKDSSSNQTITREILTSDNTPIAGDNVFTGFTSSTGGNATTHKLLKWYFENSYVEDGLNPVSGTYTQAPVLLNVVTDRAENPGNAIIILKDSEGVNMLNESFSIYIDDELIEEESGDFSTGSSGVYYFSVPSDLDNGNHNIRVVGAGGVTNYADFSINKNTITYDGNGNTGGTVPASGRYNNGSVVTVASNSGLLVREGYDFADWNTQADGNGIRYVAGSDKIEKLTSDITLYAMWDVKPVVKAPNPKLSFGIIDRNTDTTGTVYFISDKEGSFYYEIVEDNADVPTIDTSGEGFLCLEGDNSIENPVGLTAGAKDMYIIAKDAEGNLSNLLKIDIAPAWHDTTQDASIEEPTTVSTTASVEATTQTGDGLFIHIIIMIMIVSISGVVYYSRKKIR